MLTWRRIKSKENSNIYHNRHAKQKMRYKMFIITIERAGTYTVAQLKRGIKGREQLVRATLTITGNKTHSCLMIILLFKHTHVHKHAHRRSILHAVCSLTEQLRAASAKRFIKTSKRSERISSPCSSSLGRFLWESGIGFPV